MERIRAREDTFCIAVLGDFLGTGPLAREGPDPTWVPRRATPDTLMTLTGLRPRISVARPSGQGTVELELESLRDFQPDALFRKLPQLRRLREAREAALGGRPEAPVPGESEAPGESSGAAPPVSPERSSGPGLLEAILDATQGAAAPPEPGTPEEIAAWARELARPHLVPDDTESRARVALVDRTASQALSRILHSEPVQRLEAIWRSVTFLLSRVDTVGKVRVYLVHLPAEALRQDLPEGGDPLRSRLLELLSAPELGVPGRRWSLILGAYGMKPLPQDLSLLGRVARVARFADVPWISSLRPPETSGRAPDEEPALEEGPLRSSEEWLTLRRGTGAAWLALTYPRFLVREPFGPEGPRSDELDFREEIGSDKDLLWGEACFLPAVFLTQEFQAGGESRAGGRQLQLEGMPFWDPSPGSPPAAPTSVEERLDPQRAHALIREGIIPVLGFPQRAAVGLGGLHSLAGPNVKLRAWWRE